MEFASYSDSDRHITVVTPSMIALGIENTSGAVAAAPPIWSTSSRRRRWTSSRPRRRAGGKCATPGPWRRSTSQHDFKASAWARRCRSEPGLPVVRGAMRDRHQGLRREELVERLSSGTDSATTSSGAAATTGPARRSASSRAPSERGSFNGGLDFVIDQATRSPVDHRRRSSSRSTATSRSLTSLRRDVRPDIAAALPKRVRRSTWSIRCASRRSRWSSCRSRGAGSRVDRTLRAQRLRDLDAPARRARLRRLVGATSPDRPRDLRWIFDLGRGDLRDLRPHAVALPRAELRQLSLAARVRLGARAPGVEPPGVPGTGDRRARSALDDRGRVRGQAVPRQQCPAGRSGRSSSTGDSMYTAFLDDLYLTHRTAVLGALGLEGQF